MKPRSEMVRIIVDGDRGAVLDVKMRLGGRGAYLCRNRECVDRALERGLLARALKRSLFPVKGAVELARERFLATVRGEVDGQACL